MADRQRPNVILFLTDDLGWGDLGCYGHQHINTPNLDRFAGQGTIFTQYYSNSGVCSPSRAAYMTGQYPARHGIHGHLATHEYNEQRGMPNWLGADVPTVTECLQDAGYVTGHFGKWHLGHGEGAPDPGQYGIDEHKTVNTTGPGWPEVVVDDEYFRARSTELSVDEGIEFIERHRDEPFYLNLWSLLPHATLHPFEEQMEQYQHFGPRDAPYKGAMQIYYASVTDIDTQFGRLMETLEEMDLADDTLVAFSSDNGPEDIHITNASHSGVGSPGPFRGRKRSLYEGGVRMPFIARWPGVIPEGAVDDDSVMTAVDWLPTISGLAEADRPAHYAPDGEDIIGMLGGSTRPREKSIFWEWRFKIFGHVIHHSPILAIRDGKWKLLVNPDHTRLELYDIPRDPMELDDVSTEYPDIVDELRNRAVAWQETLPEGPFDDEAGSNDYPWPKES